MIVKVGRYQWSTLFITFKSQSKGQTNSKYAGHGAPWAVLSHLNEAATASWAKDMDPTSPPAGPWEHVCEFAVQMKSSGEAKRAMLFRNTVMKDVSVEWIKRVMRD